MPRYFFNIQDDKKGLQRDAEGVELADIEMVCQEAKQVLPDIARDEIPADGDQRIYTVLVTDENERPVYSATLTYAGSKILE